MRQYVNVGFVVLLPHVRGLVFTYTGVYVIPLLILHTLLCGTINAEFTDIHINTRSCEIAWSSSFIKLLFCTFLFNAKVFLAAPQLPALDVQDSLSLSCEMRERSVSQHDWSWSNEFLSSQPKARPCNFWKKKYHIHLLTDEKLNSWEIKHTLTLAQFNTPELVWYHQ